MPAAKAFTSFTLTVLFLCLSVSPARAESTVVSVIISWQGQGQIHPVGVGKYQFLGSIEGILYAETPDGLMNEAFVRCPVVQDFDAQFGSTSVSGRCVIVVSPEDTVFADLTCDGITGLCAGDFTITGGTGRFEGVTGSGEMTVRSPVHALAADLSEGAIIRAAAGILQVPELEVTVP